MADTDVRAEIDARIAAIADPALRKLVEALRATIRAAAPEAEEVISYRMPGFAQNGVLVTYDAFRAHGSLFPMGHTVLDGMAEEVAPFRASKGTLQFTPDNPMPASLVTRIVKARLEENAARRKRTG